MSAARLRASPADLRLAGPVGSSWVVGTVLVGVPHLAVPVVVVAASAVVGALVVLIGLEPAALLRVRRSRCCALLPVRLRSALRRRVATADLVRGACALALTTALLVGLLAVAVAVGQGRREPSVLLDASGRTSDVRVRLDRDLAPGDRSVVGTVVAVRTGASRPDGLRVPVRLVPAGDEPRRVVLPAGTVLDVRGPLQQDEAGATTAFVLFVRGDLRVVDGPHGVLGASAVARAAFVTVTADLPEPGATLLRGLAIGDRSGLDPLTEQAMETSALTHLTAVSGDTVHEGGGS